MQSAGHTGIVQRAAAGESAAGSEGSKSVWKFLLLVPPDHGDILVPNGKTWLTFNKENKSPLSHEFYGRPLAHLQELVLKH